MPTSEPAACPATSDRRRVAVLVGLGLLFLAPGMLWELPGAKAIVGAQRILRGEVPYRDFWTMYAPGQFYAVAGLFRVFGQHNVVQGIASIAIVAGTGGALFSLARRIGAGLNLATALGATYVVAQWSTNPTIDSYHPAMLLALLGVDRVVAALGGAAPRTLLEAGVLFGLAACFKHDVAFHIAAASCAAVVVAGRVAARAPAAADGRARSPAGWGATIREVARIGAGAAVMLVPVGALLAASAGRHVWECLFVFPAREFPLVMRQDYAGLLPRWAPIAEWLETRGGMYTSALALEATSQWALLSLPQAVFLAGGAWLVLRRRTLEPRLLACGVLCLAAIPFFWLAAHVQHNTHPTSMAVFSLLFGIVFRVATRERSPSGAARRWFVAGFSAYACLLSAKPLIHAVQMAYFWPEGRPLDLPVADGVRVRRDHFEAYDPIVRFVREHVPPEEAIYSGVVRHDAIVINNQAMYYLADRPVAVRWNELHPALADSPEVQREIIASLEAKGVRCVILWRFGWTDEVLDAIREKRREKLPHLGATLLDEHIRREYEVISTHGEYLLCWRKDALPPRPWRESTEDPDITREDLRRRR